MNAMLYACSHDTLCKTTLTVAMIVNDLNCWKESTLISNNSLKKNLTYCKYSTYLI
jgi:hypothetical protein